MAKKTKATAVVGGKGKPGKAAGRPPFKPGEKPGLKTTKSKSPFGKK